jgi:ABC-type multidrug transport system fused ATPase/permease subunit
VLQSLFGKSGLALDSCAFGECVSQGVVDVAGGAATPGQHGASKQLSGGVIAGLAVVGALILLSLVALVFGLMAQKKARSAGLTGSEKTGGVVVEWTDVSYVIPGSKQGFAFGRRKTDTAGFSDDKVILDNVSGKVAPGQIMAILGPSGVSSSSH